MKSITIHKLDGRIARLLEEKARRDNTSLNQVIKRLLQSALGLDHQPLPDHRSEFEDLFGTWTREEAAAFDGRVADLGAVDADEW